MRFIHDRRGGRRRHARTAFAALLLLSTLLTSLAGTAQATHPRGTILVLDLGTTTPAQSLLAAGYAQCPSSGARPPVCFDVVSPLQFRNEAANGFAGRRVIYVGWGDTATTPLLAAYGALYAQRAQIASFVANGGGLVAYAQSTANAQLWDWIPGGQYNVNVAYTNTAGNAVAKTTIGSAHDTMALLSNGDLSNWNSAYHQYFRTMPSYLQTLATTGVASQRVTVAGFWGRGCVFASGQDHDWHAADDPVAAVRDAAQRAVKNSVDWAHNCGCRSRVYVRDHVADEAAAAYPVAVLVDEQLDKGILPPVDLPRTPPLDRARSVIYVTDDSGEEGLWLETNDVPGLQADAGGDALADRVVVPPHAHDHAAHAHGGHAGG